MSGCLNCPLCDYEVEYNAYYCRGIDKDQHKLIDDHVEYPSELKPTPDWCPIKKILKENVKSISIHGRRR